jgi:hypothetical protein
LRRMKEWWPLYALAALIVLLGMIGSYFNLYP